MSLRPCKLIPRIQSSSLRETRGSCWTSARDPAEALRGAFLALVAFWAVATGCGQVKTLFPTQTVVVVDAELVVQGRADTLRVVVRSEDDGDEVFKRTYRRQTETLVWPRVLPLEPKGGDASRRFEVEATAYDVAGKVITTVRAISGYIEHRQLVLRLVLEDACIEVECGDEETCRSGKCTSAVVDPADLAPFSAGEVSLRDGGAFISDAGGIGPGPTPGDAGSDAAVMQVCEPNPDSSKATCREICSEACNDEDDDCDKKVDEDSDGSCRLAHAVAECASGACAVASCKEDYADCNGDAGDGCEQDVLADGPCVDCLAQASNFDATKYTYTKEVDLAACGTKAFAYDSSTNEFTPAKWCGVVPGVSGSVTQTKSGGPRVDILRFRSFVLPAGKALTLVGSEPVIFAVNGDATIAGTIDASSTLVTTRGAGGGASCTPTSGQGSAGSGNATNGSGSGGGGGGGGGAAGGSGSNGIGTGFSAGGAGGAALVSAALSPLRGGCDGGQGGDDMFAPNNTTALGFGGYGGGAVQISTAGNLTVMGTIDVGGGGGKGALGDDEDGGGGGGAGGGILLEAGMILTTSQAMLYANGGSGAEGCTGADMTTPPNPPCGGIDGGDGAAVPGATADGTLTMQGGPGGVGGSCVGVGCLATAGATGGVGSAGGSGGGGGGGGAGGKVVARLLACSDECPTDPNKNDPGACGCGVPDTDRDRDGTPDCDDQCPWDPSTSTTPCSMPSSNYEHYAYTYTRNITFNCNLTYDSADNRFETTTTSNVVMPNCCGAAPSDCPEMTFDVAQTSGGGPSVDILRFASFMLNVGNTFSLIGDDPVIIAVDGNATVAGTIDASSTPTAVGAGANWNCTPAPTGGQGTPGTGACATGSGGGGGGGYGTAGGAGGAFGGSGLQGSGGAAHGGATLIPLFGGCPGGLGSSTLGAPGQGGGAVEISASGTITITGTVRANGGTGGLGCSTVGGGGGGGSGGAILIEAPIVTTTGATLTAYGGTGGSGGTAGGGAGSTSSASTGAVGTAATGTGGGGGGGGGYGRVRINTD